MAERLRAGALGKMITALFRGDCSRFSEPENFDPALVIYTFAVIFATWGIVYHYAVWLDKPPRAGSSNERGIAPAGGPAEQRGHPCENGFTHVIEQNIYCQTLRLRWLMHQCLFWGCVTAAPITFPLVFGWIHFAAFPTTR